MNVNHHHVVRRPFLLPISNSSRIIFPVIKRLEQPISSTSSPSSKPEFTPISYYSIRFDKTPPQHELFNLCLISEDHSAFLKMFHIYSNRYTFIAPAIQNITSVLLAPVENEWSISYIDIESRTLGENKQQIVSNFRFVSYYGDIETTCFFIPERELNKDIQKQGIETYIKQKESINRYTVGFLVGGSILFQVTAGAHSTCVFIFGCIVGIIYQLLLQYEIDRLGKQQMFINSATRLGVIGLSISIIFQNSKQLVPADLWIGLSGFMVQKIALLIVFL